MRATFTLFAILLLAAISLDSYAQQRIDVNLFQRPIHELFEQIERQSPYRIYTPAEPELDSLKVTVRAQQLLPTEILRQALDGTSYQVSTYNQSIFIMKDRWLTVTVPEFAYTDTDKAGKNRSQDTLSVNFSLSQSGEQRADSEFRTYEVGNPEAQASGRVIINGYVFDSKTGEPVAGVILQIDGTHTSTVTDGYGYYRFNLAPGEYVINILGAGQEDSKRRVKLYSEGKLDILSTEKVHTFREITVYGDRRDNVRQTTIGVEKLKMQEIKNIPTVFGESDILKVVTALPGVKAAGEVSSGFNVRGGATDQNLILYNDGTIYNPNHLFGLFSAFNPDIVRDMELFKSSVPAKYGGRISSVLDINSREGNKKEFGGSASIGLLTSRLALEGPIIKDRTAFIVGGRTTYSDWLLSTLPRSSGYKDGSANFYDLNATLSHKFNEMNNLYVNGYYSQDRFRFEEFDLYKYRNANASIKWRHIFNSRFFGVFAAGYDHYDYDTENTETESMAYRMKFGIDQVFGKIDFSYQVNDKHTFTFGASSQHYELKPGEYMPLGENSLVAYDQLQTEKALESAVYFSDQWEISPAVALDLGIRYSMYNVLGPRTYNTYPEGELPSTGNITGSVEEGSGILKTYHGPEFRASVRFALTDDFSIKAGVNSMRQYIHKISNTTVMSPTDTWKLSDMNIRPQKGIQYALGFYKDLKDQFVEMSAEVYYKTMDDYLDYRNGAELLMNHHLETDVINTEGRAYGAELMIRRTEGKLNGWVSYTWSKTELRQNDHRILNPVNKGDWYAADFDKPHEFKLIGNYRFSHRLSVSLNCEYATGRPITLPASKYEYAGGEYVYYTDRNSHRVPDYFRMDFSFNIEPSHHLTLLTHSTITMGVYNITGRKNAHSVYYKHEDGEIKGYKLAIFGAPIPYISYNIKF